MTAEAQMTLAELIEAYKGARSYAALEDATHGVVKTSRWHQYATRQPTEAPGPDKIRAVAQALGVSELTVWLAVGSSLGINVAEQGVSLAELPVDVAQPIATLVTVLRGRM
jgi:hypothetical protein